MFRTCSVSYSLYWHVNEVGSQELRKIRIKWVLLKAPRLQGGGGYWEVFLIWNWLSAKNTGKKSRKKICRPPPWRQSIFQLPSDRIPMKYGPNSSSSKRLQAMARRDDHLAQRGACHLEKCIKQNSNKRRISDSPVISIVSKLKRHESISSRLPPLSSPISKSIPKVPI